MPTRAREPARCGGLLEVWQPRTLDAAAKDSDEPPAAGTSHPAGPWPLALLCVAESCRSLAPHAGGPAGPGRLRNALVRPLVDLVETARFVSRDHSFFLEKQEADR